MLAAPNGGDSRYFPAADDCVFSGVHGRAKLLALAKRHVVGVADRKAVAKVRVYVASLSVGVIRNLGITGVGSLETPQVVAVGVSGEQGQAAGESLFEFGLQSIVVNRKVRIVNRIDDREVRQDV